jgi:hypothetical protein
MRPVADPWTTPVAPFKPAAAEEARESPGCRKALLIGCGLLLVLAVAGFVAITLEAPAILRWSFRLAEASISPRLPADATPEERRRLHLAFEAAGRTKVADQPGLARLQRAQGKIMALSNSSAPLTHQQMRELTEALEAVARQPPPAPASPKVPPPAPPPARTSMVTREYRGVEQAAVRSTV